MTSNQPSRGRGRGRGGQTSPSTRSQAHPNNQSGRGCGGDQQDLTRYSSASSESSPTQSQAQTRLNDQPRGPGGNAVVAHSQQGRLPECQLSDDRPDVSPNNTSSPSPSAGYTPRLTPRKEQVITQQPTPSSGSYGSLHSNKSMGCTESSHTKLSYIGAFEKGSDKHKILESKTLMFLTNFKKDGEVFPYYQAELSAIKHRSPFCLTIQFRHMIKHDIELAFETWKNRGNTQDWLLPGARKFLKLHNYGSDDDVMNKTRLEFYGFPSSMRKVRDVLRNAAYSLKLFGGKYSVCEATSDGKLVVQLFLATVFARHANDLSWDGNFSVDDMFLVNNMELQICSPCMLATGSSRLRDLQKGVEKLLPFFNGRDGYPPYFNQLEEDIQQASIRQIMEPWCVEYFTFHMATLPSLARRHFEIALHYIYKNIPIELDGIFGRLTSEMVTPWQISVENSRCNMLKDVLDYIDPATGRKVKYENNIGGLVKYKRHFLEHAFGELFDINDIELLGASKFPNHLPGVVKLLLNHNKMVNCFGAPWSLLKSSRFDGRDTPAKQ